MIERRGFCNRCGLCELGRDPDGNGNPVGDATLIVWDPLKTPGEANACFHQLIRDLAEGVKTLSEVQAEWISVEPTFDGNVQAYLDFPQTPDAVVEGCNYRFDQNAVELLVKRVDATSGVWLYSGYDKAQSIVLNNRLYGEV